jgi:hypothetical protein
MYICVYLYILTFAETVPGSPKLTSTLFSIEKNINNKTDKWPIVTINLKKI